MSTEKQKDRSFASFLRSANEGDIHAEASHEFDKLLSALYEDSQSNAREAAGTITVTFAIKMDERGRCAIAGDVKTKLPAKKRVPGVAFHDPDTNTLSTSNLRQGKLPYSSNDDGERDRAPEPKDESRKAAAL